MSLPLLDADLILPAAPDQWPDLPDAFGALATTRRGGVSVGPYGDNRGGGGLNLGLQTGDDLEHVVELRQKLEPDPSAPRYFLTVHGVGYRFVA